MACGVGKFGDMWNTESVVKAESNLLYDIFNWFYTLCKSGWADKMQEN